MRAGTRVGGGGHVCESELIHHGTEWPLRLALGPLPSALIQRQVCPVEIWDQVAGPSVALREPPTDELETFARRRRAGFLCTIITNVVKANVNKGY